MFDFWEKLTGDLTAQVEAPEHDPVFNESTSNENKLLERISALEKQIAEMEIKNNGSDLQNQSDSDPC